MTIDPSQGAIRPLAFLVAALLAAHQVGPPARDAMARPSAERYLAPSRSVDLLRVAFDAVADRSFRQPQVVVAPTSAATWALADDVNVANRVVNPQTGRPWARGDARVMWPEGMGGFTDPVTGEIFINAHIARPSHVPHELLHANSSLDFLATFGVAVNEGVTEQLALDALAASEVRAEKHPAYVQERALAAAIAVVAGRDRLVEAYFNGGPHLAELVAVLGAGIVTSIRSAAGDVRRALAVVTALNRVTIEHDDGGARSSPVQG